MEEKMKKHTTITIPLTVAKKLKERIEGTGFHSLSSYVTYILRQLLSGIEKDKEEKEAFSQEDEERVKKRLRALGYID